MLALFVSVSASSAATIRKFRTFNEANNYCMVTVATRNVKVHFGDDSNDINKILNQPNATHKIIGIAVVGTVMLILGIIVCMLGYKITAKPLADNNSDDEADANQPQKT